MTSLQNVASTDDIRLVEVIEASPYSGLGRHVEGQRAALKSLLHASRIRQISLDLVDAQGIQLRIVFSGERPDLETQPAQPPDQRTAYEAAPPVTTMRSSSLRSSW